MSFSLVRLRSRFFWLLPVMALLVLVYFLPYIDDGQDCTTRTALLPLEYFRIEQLGDGRLQTVHGRHWPEQVAEVRGFTPERGDWFRLSFRAFGEQLVEAGDTLFSLYSSRQEQDLIELEGRLRQARQRLQLLRSGKRSETLQRLRKEEEVVKADLALREKQYQRATEMWKDSLISTSDYEEAEALLEQARQAHAAALAAVREAEAGVHPEEIKLQEERIAVLEESLRQLKARAWIDAITAPFGGVLHYRDAFTPSLKEKRPKSRSWELWRADSLLLRIPIPVSCLPRLQRQTSLTLYLPDTTLVLPIELQAEHWTPVLLNKREVVYYLAKTPWFPHPQAGGVFPCSVHLKRVGWKQYWREILGV